MVSDQPVFQSTM